MSALHGATVSVLMTKTMSRLLATTISARLATATTKHREGSLWIRVLPSARSGIDVGPNTARESAGR